MCISIADLSLKGMFSVKEHIWRSGIVCISAFTTKLLFTISTQMLLLFLSMCHGDREVMTFLHRKDQCTSCQGPLGPSYSPVNTAICRLRDRKATASNALLTVVARDVMSYRMSGRWRMQLYIAAYIIIRRYKSGCALVPGSLFVSPLLEYLNTPLAS